MQGHYKRLQEDNAKDELIVSGSSGVVGGGIGELYKALSKMREKRDFFQKSFTKNEKNKKRGRKSFWERRWPKWRCHGSRSGAQKREARMVAVIAVRETGMAVLG